ncbi:MAG: sigma factor-like helix-turn-helix DNA-binding protein [Bacteroidota bacterium]
MEQRELEMIIRQAVEILPEKRKEVYLLTREAGLSHQEIADKLGIASVQ